MERVINLCTILNHAIRHLVFSFGKGPISSPEPAFFGQRQDRELWTGPISEHAQSACFQSSAN